MQPRRSSAAAAFMVVSAPAATLAQGAGGGHGHVHSGREQPVDAASFGATAAALARGSERRTFDFRPAVGNRLAARVDFPFDGKFRATVTLRGPGGDLGTGRSNVDPVR